MRALKCCCLLGKFVRNSLSVLNLKFHFSCLAASFIRPLTVVSLSAGRVDGVPVADPPMVIFQI